MLPQFPCFETEHKMAHPVHEANDNSPFGDLTREEFYKKHRVLHHQAFILNKHNMKIFTQSWCPHSESESPASKLRGMVGLVHGYADESSWLVQLTAVGLAKAGFYVCALDLQGHGYSEGSRAHIPSLHPLVEDCIQVFDSARKRHKHLPAFLFGESLGGAISILICLKQRTEWNGLILNAAMCGVSKKFKPIWPLEELLPAAAFLAPNWRISITEDPAKKSYKEEWKRKLSLKSPNRVAVAKPTAATALEFLRICEYIKRNCHGLEVPVLVVHGGDDKICDPETARFVYEKAASKDKTLRIFEGMWHQFIGEPREGVEKAFGTILAWIRERADRARATSEAFHVEK